MMVSFQKPSLNHQDQLRLLESRGLAVTDRSFALHCLQHVDYYRLSAYRHPLTVQGNPDQFLPNTSFADLWSLYDFDQVLRRLVLDAIERVEISIRAHWAYVLGHKYGPFCYEDSAIFENHEEHLKTLARLYNDLANSKEDFVKHFKDKYGLTRPPVWAACEVLSFGQLSHLCQNLKEPSDRKTIADPFGIDEKVLVSYLNHLTVVRNTAAHHGRLWNRKFGVKFALPHRPDRLRNSLSTEHHSEKRIYNTLTMLLHLLGVIEPNSSVGRLLFTTVGAVDSRFHPQMGFPTDWRSRPLWASAAPPP